MFFLKQIITRNVQFTIYRIEHSLTKKRPLEPINVAGAEGLEPPTPGFGDLCSTN